MAARQTRRPHRYRASRPFTAGFDEFVLPIDAEPARHVNRTWGHLAP